MSRLPIPGADNDIWGSLLNDFLSVSLLTDGTIKPSAIQLQDGSVTFNKLDPSVQQTISSPSGSSAVTSVAGKTGAVTLTKNDVGLSNVDDTSDLAKPVSTATASALATKADTSSLATVATSGSYSDLFNKPTLTSLSGTQTAGKYLRSDGVATALSSIIAADVPTLNQNTTGTAASITGSISESQVTNLVSDLAAKADAASLATVATTGSYTDLTNKPAIQAVSDATTTSKGIVELSGDLGGTAASPSVLKLNGVIPAAVATSGSYADLSNKPTITTLAGTQTAGQYLRSDGTTTSLSAIQPADIPTLNQNTTGTAATITGSITESQVTNLTTDLSAKANSASLATVATSGSYTDLLNKPTIPTVSDATTTGKGIIQLAGDLSGTAASPTVPGLATKLSSSLLGAPSGVAQLDSGSKVPITQVPVIPRIHAFSYTGTLVVVSGTHRLYNDSGSAWTILGVRASIGSAASGSSVIIDVLMNGTTIFTTQANRPTIAAGSYTSGNVTNMDITSVPNGNYLTINIAQIGSSAAGGDLTLQLEVW